MSRTSVRSVADLRIREREERGAGRSGQKVEWSRVAEGAGSARIRPSKTYAASYQADGQGEENDG